ncbi:MAG: bifunctional hydroxymethylpyrimidine kinase/phosphomethylpyrimidine kinase [Thermodesulfobacteriota bacterium]
MKTVLIIAGSDPGGGAGLQQDLKVATLLGTYGLTVVTALTIQNSREVRALHPVDPEVVAAQLDAVLSDFPLAAVKIGMLATGAIAQTVAEKLQAMKLPPLVLDPVLAAGHGPALLDEAGVKVLVEKLFPLTDILTPNVPEAAALTGLKIITPAHLEDAARRLQALGPKWVLAKGGHLPGEPVDVLTDGKNFYHLPNPRLPAPNHHGSGCLLATALAAHLAQGRSVPEAVNQARDLVLQSLRFGLPLGGGVGPVNPYAPFARDLSRYEVLEALKQAAARLQKENLRPLIPEVMTNLGYATPYPAGPRDVAAFPGRLVKGPEGVIIPASPAFGASRHIAATILTAMNTHPHLRAAMNIKYLDDFNDLAPLLHLNTATLDPSRKPPQSTPPGQDTLYCDIASLLKPGEPPPDLIFTKGDWGLEPGTLILGPDPMTVAEKALALKNALQAGGRL